MKDNEQLLVSFLLTFVFLLTACWSSTDIYSLLTFFFFFYHCCLLTSLYLYVQTYIFTFPVKLKLCVFVQVPALCEDLLSSVDQPLKITRDTVTGKDYLLCDYNRDGDSYRSSIKLHSWSFVDKWCFCFSILTGEIKMPTWSSSLSNLFELSIKY